MTAVAKRAGAEDRSSSESNGSAQADSHGQEQDEVHKRKKLAKKVLGKKAQSEDEKAAKTMELAYWLELVDHKHRHGSNLRKYHAYWQKQDTAQSFFTWLDNGDGKDVSLEECSRERLNQMQVRYLSRSERMNYLVKINGDGLLIWAKNGDLVWTKDELYKDSMEGIVPTNDPTPAFEYNVAPEKAPSEGTTSESEPDEEKTTKADEGEQYTNEEFHRARGPAKLNHVSASVLYNHMIHSSLKKGHKWIFVADTSFRLYVGYKQAGAFQHSSFLHGSRIMAAGQIKVKRGQLRRLSPLSGHYRPRVANFKAFVQHLKDAGTDMSHLSVSQSYAVLLGLEGYTKTRKKVKAAGDTVSRKKDERLHPDKIKEAEEAQKDKSQSAEKERQHLEQQRAARERSHQEAKSDKSVKGRVSRLMKRFNLSDNASESDRKHGGGQEDSGPEAGIPPPEGK